MKRLLALISLWLLGPFAAAAAPLPETFPLGQSGASGAVCEAVRDYLDPLGQGRDAHAWRVRCRGYNTALGRIYQLPAAGRAGWQAALAARADCPAPQAAPKLGVAATRASCKAAASATPYVVFTAQGKGSLVVTEGLAPLADVLETGLKVAAGVAKPPPITAVQTSAAQAEIAADFPGMSGLASAEAAAAADPARLRGRGYVQNNEWRFDEAENAFRALVIEAEARNAPAGERAEALLNLAMNISNNGRFAEAEAYFEEAANAIPADDALLHARGLNYRALHERNRGRFDRAIQAAKAALRARAAASGGSVTAGPYAGAAGGSLEIDERLAQRLNVAAGAQADLTPPRVSLADQLAIQDAQAWQVIGSSKAELGDAAGAREALERARDLLLRAASAGHLTAWLQSRVEADLAGLDLRAGQAGPAAERYARAVAILRTRHAGSSAEGGLLFDLGRAQSAAGQEAKALDTFARAMNVFRGQRGGLGASADAAAPYLDLLLKVIAREPQRAPSLAAQFFEVAEAAISSSTAETVNRLAARVASGDGHVATLARAFEDAGRRVRATESQVAGLQADGAYTGAARTQFDAQLANQHTQVEALEAQLLAAAPRYNQLVAPGAPAAAVQKALRDGEAYVKLLPLAGRTYGVLLTHTAIRAYAVDLRGSEVTAQVGRLRVALTSGGEFDVKASAALFDSLFGPVRGELLASQRLIYEPSGSLVSLPAGVFVTDAAGAPAPGAGDYTQVAWLGGHLDSSLVLSGASFLQSRAFAASRAKQAFIGFGDPVLPRSESRAYASVTRAATRRRGVLEQVCGSTRDQLLAIEALPETAAEVRSVGTSLGAAGSVVLGADFTDEALKARADLSDFHVLYFATHGLLPMPNACISEPALVTSLGGGDSDALLETGEILDLKLDADLVVLAACDTGGAGADTERTGLTGGGEALGGLTRAMIYAGSRAMIVSHWSVDSRETARLMIGLFGSDAPTLAEGLRKSQLLLQKDPALSNPFYWAAFTIVGDGGRALPGAAPVSAAQP